VIVDWGDWFPALFKTRWADTGQPLTSAETLEAIRARTLRRPLKISVRVPWGTETVVLPVGQSIFKADGMLEIIYEAIGAQLRKKKISSKQAAELFELMSGVDRKTKPKKLRAHATVKLKNTHQFRKRLRRIKVRSRKPFSKNPRHKFMRLNWRELTTVKNLACRNQPGLMHWRPTLALKLMEVEGVPLEPEHDRRWFTRTRTHLGLVPAMTYSVTSWPGDS
jgi:hypothetical protein